MKLVINDFCQNDWLLPLTAVLKGRIRLFRICFGNTAIEFNRTRTKAKHVYVCSDIGCFGNITNAKYRRARAELFYLTNEVKNEIFENL